MFVGFSALDLSALDFNTDPEQGHGYIHGSDFLPKPCLKIWKVSQADTVADSATHVGVVCLDVHAVRVLHV